jgi:hypothetical protein
MNLLVSRCILQQKKNIQPKEDNEPPNLSSSYVGFSWVVKYDNESKGLLLSLNFFSLVVKYDKKLRGLSFVS